MQQQQQQAAQQVKRDFSDISVIYSDETASDMSM